MFEHSFNTTDVTYNPSNYSRSRTWFRSKPVTWLSMSYLKLRNIRVIFPKFQDPSVARKIWRIMDTIAPFDFKICSGICPRILSVPRSKQFWGKLSFSERIMSEDKYLSIFSCQIKANGCYWMAVWIHHSISGGKCWKFVASFLKSPSSVRMYTYVKVISLNQS